MAPAASVFGCASTLATTGIARIACGVERAQLRRQPLLCRRHQRTMERCAHRQRDHPLGAARLRQLAGARHRGRMPGNHHLPRCVEVRRRDHLAALDAGRLTGLADDRRIEPEHGRHRAVPTGTASCMYRPLRRTVRRASAKDSVPAATCAEYSPRLWPAANDGSIAVLARPADTPQRSRRGWPAACSR